MGVSREACTPTHRYGVDVAPIQIKFYQYERMGWYRLARESKELQKGREWQCLLPIPGILDFRLPISHRDRWPKIAASLTGMTEEEVLARGIRIKVPATGEVHDL